MGMTKISNQNSLFQISNKNVAFLSVLLVSAILALAVFANPGSQAIHLIRLNGSGLVGGSAGYNLTGTLGYGTNNSNITYNLTIQFALPNASTNITGFAITSTNTTYWNFTYVSPGNVSTSTDGNNSSIETCVFNTTHVGGISSAINCTPMENANWTNGNTVSIVFGVNFTYEGIYNFSINVTHNMTGAVANNSNASYFSALVDLTNPVLKEVVISNVSQNNNQSYFLSNGSANITFVVNDTNLNFTQDGNGAWKLNITLYNASDNSTQADKYNLIPSGAAATSVAVANRSIGSGNFSFELRVAAPNSSTGCTGSFVNCSLNMSAIIVATDNVTKSVTRYWGGNVIFDNQSPRVTSTVPANGTREVATNSRIEITWSEILNASTVNNTTIHLFITSGGSNTSKQVSYANISNVGVITIDPEGDLAGSTNYTINISHSNASNTIRDMAGNHIVSNSYIFNFATAAAGTTGSTGGAATGAAAAGGVVVSQVVSEDKPVATVSFNVGESATFSVGGDSHSVKVDSISGGIVNIVIASTPLKLALQVNKPQYVDVDADGDNDIIVTLLEILSSSAAKIKIEYLAAAAKETGTKAVAAPSTPAVSAPVEEAPAAEAPVEEAPAEEAAAAKPISTTMLLVVVVVIVLVGLGYWFTQKKGQVTPSYRSL